MSGSIRKHGLWLLLAVCGLSGTFVRADDSQRPIGFVDHKPHPTPATAPDHHPELTGLNGYCVVELHNRKFVKTKPNLWSVHRRRIYFFSSATAKKKFDADPNHFAVRFSGMDMVEFALKQDFVEGKYLHQNKDGYLYLFATPHNREIFSQERDSILQACKKTSQHRTVSHEE